MKTIGFYVSPGFQMLDLAGPAGAFEAANRELGRPAYRITVLAAEAGRDQQPRHDHRCRVGRRGRA